MTYVPRTGCCCVAVANEVFPKSEDKMNKYVQSDVPPIPYKTILQVESSPPKYMKIYFVICRQINSAFKKPFFRT